MRCRSRQPWADRQGWEADEALLVVRLRELGLRSEQRVELHDNSTVMVSVTQRGVLRIHRAYAYASDHVLRAIVIFASPRTRRQDRALARRTITTFPAERVVPRQGGRRRRTPVDPADVATLSELGRLHARLNRTCFGDALGRITFRLSNRMETRLGEITVDRTTGCAIEIAISRRHVERDGWDGVRDTLLHEMIHQWQVESGGEPDHGPEFRRKARALGITPSAVRDLGPPAMAHASRHGGR